LNHVLFEKPANNVAVVGWILPAAFNPIILPGNVNQYKYLKTVRSTGKSSICNEI